MPVPLCRNRGGHEQGGHCDIGGRSAFGPRSHCRLRGRVKRDAMWLDLGNGHRHGQAVFGALAPAMRAEYPCVLDVYPEVRHMQDDTRKSCSTAEALASQDCLVNRTITTAGLSALWEVLRYGATDKHWIVIDLKTGMQSAHSFPPI